MPLIELSINSRVRSVFLPELKAKTGRIEKTTTSKDLMHSSDHINENRATTEGGSLPYTPLGESVYDVCGIIMTVRMWA